MLKALIEILFLSIVTQQALGQTVFFDGTFNDADWSVDVFVHNNGGWLDLRQQTNGGNPGSFQEVTQTLNPAGTENSYNNTFHWRTNATYDPQMAGGIASIDYQEDSVRLDQYSRSSGQRSGPVIRQGTNIYIQGGFDTPERSWTTKAIRNLVSEAFWLWEPNGEFPWFDMNQHPDFSENGQPLEFGFRRGSARAPPAASGWAPHIVGIDNWTVTVHAAHEPRLSIVVSDMELCWDTITNLVYQLQYRSDLTTSEWVPLGGLIVGDGSMYCINDAVMWEGQRFYRVVVTNGVR